MKKLVLTSLFCINFTILGGPAFSQSFFPDLYNKKNTEKREPSRNQPSEETQSELLQKQKSLETLGLETQALETAIDPHQYSVGPGDQFLITVWSALQSNYLLPVTPEGKLIIPTVGTLNVNGMLLTQVHELVKKEAGKKYVNTEVSVNLAAVRNFRVHVTGQVSTPGIYIASAVQRVSDVIEKAGGLTAWAYERKIEVRHTDGSLDSLDLYQYKKLGNLDANIFLRSGDMVYVPSIDLKKPTIQIEGKVNDAGIYQISDSETLHDFMLRVDALNRQADLNHAYIERKNSVDGKVESIALFPYLTHSGDGFSELILQDGDIIKMPQRLEQVYVIGAVQNPGPYPYVPNLKAFDFVGLAGSNFQASDISKTKIIRKDSNKEERGKDMLVGPGDTVFVPRKVEFGVEGVLAIVSTAASILISMKAIGAF